LYSVAKDFDNYGDGSLIFFVSKAGCNVQISYDTSGGRKFAQTVRVPSYGGGGL